MRHATLSTRNGTPVRINYGASGRPVSYRVGLSDLRRVQDFQSTLAFYEVLARVISNRARPRGLPRV